MQKKPRKQATSQDEVPQMTEGNISKAGGGVYNIPAFDWKGNPGVVKSAHISEIFSSVQGEGPWTGFRQLFIRFSGCDLRCQWCDTPDSLTMQSGQAARFEVIPGKEEFQDHKNPICLEDLVHAILQMESLSPHHSVSLTGGEPLLQADFIRALISSLKVLNFKPRFYLETGGHRPDLLGGLLDCIDFISFDLKLPSSTGERPIWEAHHEFLKLANGRECYAKVILTQQLNTDELDRACQLLKPYTCLLVLQPVWGEGLHFAPPKPSQVRNWYDRAIHLLGAGRVRLMIQQHKYLGQL